MTPPVWLIAEREFRAYAATLSFWIALAVGPLAMAGALGLAALAATGAAPAAVVVETPDPDLAKTTMRAVSEVAAMEGHAIAFLPTGKPVPGNSNLARLVVTPSQGGVLEARFTGAPILSPEGQALVIRTLQRDTALARLGLQPPTAIAAPPPPSAAAVDMVAGKASRFALVMMLWLTLTGSLGMLLQAVVRERANRALESLLAAAQSWEIVFGKLFGIGAVSLLVLGAWLGSAAALSPLVPQAGGLAGAVLRGLARPELLARAGIIYILAFGFYGLVTVAVGASARDTAAAQNLSRPMFTLLLAAFFTALATASGADGLGWLAYAPPFTPFMLLLQAPGETGPIAQCAAILLLTIAAGLAGLWAVGNLSLTTRTMSIPRFVGRKPAA